MRAADLKPGARFELSENRSTWYTVTEVWPEEPKGTIKAVVVFDVDGGNGVREWGAEQIIPLVNPE